MDNKIQLPEFMKIQLDFTAGLRNPNKILTNDPKEKERRIMYQKIVYNNMDEILENAFPILYEISSEKLWENLITDFIAHHKAQSPVFLKIPEEFVIYLKTTRTSQNDPPYLFELAHYEWVEHALDIANEKIDFKKINTKGDLLSGIPVISPLAQLLSYRYPVHEINVNNIPNAPSIAPHYLIAYRNTADDVGFLQVNLMTARLVELLDQCKGLTGKQALIQISNEINHPHPHQVIEAGLKTLQTLQKNDILLGTKKN